MRCVSSLRLLFHRSLFFEYGLLTRKSGRTKRKENGKQRFRYKKRYRGLIRRYSDGYKHGFLMTIELRRYILNINRSKMKSHTVTRRPSCSNQKDHQKEVRMNMVRRSQNIQSQDPHKDLNTAYHFSSVHSIHLATKFRSLAFFSCPPPCQG